MKTKEKPISHLAGQPAPDEIIIDVIELKEQYYSVHPDPENSGTENVSKIYAESFQSSSHLALILEEAQTIVSNAF